MAVETDVFRSTMLADFGQSVTLNPLVGDSSTFTAIFDADHVFEDVGGTVTFSVQQPRLTCRSSDVSDVTEGDGITTIVDGSSATYKVVSIMPDGTGITELALEKQ
jgi:hypothetical protein